MSRPRSFPPAVLPTGVVDLWILPLDVSPDERLELTQPLDAAEREQWSRMRIGGDRWAVARGTRRHVLSSYSGLHPAELRYEVGRFGKPRLAGHGTLRFNASSRGGLALLAVSNGIELGADLEHEDTALDPAQVAREFLSPLEQAAIAAARPTARRHAFALAWARHEARRKLYGIGLGEPQPTPTARAPLVVRQVAAPPRYAAAVAALSAEWRVRVREFALEPAAH